MPTGHEILAMLSAQQAQAINNADSFGMNDPFRKKTKGYDEMSIIEAPKGFKFGCDPELFVRDSGGRLVSAAGLLPGTKEEPYPVEFGAVQVDGMAAEFNIDPVDNFSDFNRNVGKVLATMESMLPKGYTLDAISSATFEQEVFDNAPDDAKQLGCSPDFNAWTGKVNPPPSDPENPLMRCAAGHLHIGWTEDQDLSDTQHLMNCRDLVKQLDWYLGAWSTKLDPDPTRRRLYGRAGACRYKSYGVEYRVLSNFWVTTRDRRLGVWNRMQTAITDMSKLFAPDRAGNVYNEILVNSINNTSMSADLQASFSYPLRTLARY